MAANVLTARVLVEAPGVQNTFNQVAAATNKAGQNLKNFTTSSGSATQSLVNLSRVAQDAPYGFIGIANNINPLLESFQRLKAETGSTSTALKSLGQSMTGAGGLGLAVGIASSLLVTLGGNVLSVGKSFSQAEVDALNFANALDTLKDSITSLENLRGAGVDIGGKLVTEIDRQIAALEKRNAAIIKQRLEDEKARQQITGPSALAKLIQQFGSIENLPDDLSKLSTFDKSLVEQVKKTNAALKSLRNQREKEVFGLVGESGKSGAELIPKKVDLKIKPNKITIEKPQILDLESVYEKLKEDNRGATTKVVDGISKVLSQQLSLIKIPISPTLQLSPNALNNAKLLADIRLQAQRLADDFNQALSEAFAGGFEAFGEGIGNLLAGNNFGKQFATVFGDLLTVMGKALIKFGIVKEGIDKILKSFTIPGAVAIGLGIFAIAAGQLIKNISGARAAGGPVSAGGTYLVGERGPELFTPNTGGNIVPNHALNQTGASLAGGMTVRIVGEFRQSGQDLIAAITLANQSKARLI